MNFPGEALATKMWETLAENGIGSLLKPWRVRREGRALADARRTELLSLAQTELDVQSIRRGEKQLDNKGNLISLRPPIQTQPQSLNLPEDNLFILDAIKGVKLKNTVDALIDEVNISRIALFAEEDLINNPGDVPSGEVSEDWLRRWRESTKGISSENLQQLWGKVLAGEFRNPGKYSLRTLDFLKNLSQEEANSIAKFGQFVISGFGVIFAEPTNLLEKHGIESRHLLELFDLGIIIFADSRNYSISSNDSIKYENVITIGSRVIQFTSEYKFKTLQFSAWCLTKLGKEIFHLGKFEENEEYFLHVANAIKNNGFVTKVGRWSTRQEDFSIHGGNTIQMHDLVEI